MDADAAQACWHQLELEQRQLFEIEQKLLREDPAFEQWLNLCEQEKLNGYHCER